MMDTEYFKLQVYNFKSEQDRYIAVSKDVVLFLENHDVKHYPDGSRVYVVNNIEYKNLGKHELHTS